MWAKRDNKRKGKRGKGQLFHQVKRTSWRAVNNRCELEKKIQWWLFFPCIILFIPCLSQWNQPHGNLVTLPPFSPLWHHAEQNALFILCSRKLSNYRFISQITVGTLEPLWPCLNRYAIVGQPLKDTKEKQWICSLQMHHVKRFIFFLKKNRKK